MNWYKRFLKEIPSWADVYLLGSNRHLCEEVAQVVNHRGHQAAGDVKPDAVVRSEAELIACLEKISTKE